MSDGEKRPRATDIDLLGDAPAPLEAGDEIVGSGTDDHSDPGWPSADRRRSGRRARWAARRKSGPRWKHALVEWGTVALVAVLLALGVRTFVFQAYFIPSGSMLPTLGIGDRILVNKLFFSSSSLKRGDVIVFARPAAATCGIGEKDLVKRVIGIPKDVVTSLGNTVVINGTPVKEPYLPSNTQLGTAISRRTQYGQYLPKRIPPGEYFVMGDNRVNSCDSRYWGYVSSNEIVGKVVLDWWHNGRPSFHIF